MPISEQLYKSILLSRKSKRLPPSKVAAVASPLLTNFEKWSGKKIRLNLGKVEFENLSENLFAQVLSSPNRLDRISRLKMPSDLLLQMKLDLSECSKSLKLPLHSDKSGKNSYVVNSLAMLKSKIKSAASVLPLHILASNNANMKGVALNRDKLLRDYQDSMTETIASQLNRVSRVPKSVNQNDIFVVYDDKATSAIELREVTDPTNSKTSTQVIVFNFAHLAPLQPLKQIIDSTTDKRIHLSMASNQELIKLIFKYLSFLT
ncbi:Rrg8p KNAG_0A07650 [Huiozyma naganishii CBS 8797]|uniref:Required for respiratory growth protein 8, mitochondrial n=1 Tax=Huiozyma naganishii (strain ATCC MYA-139 / BCRC 22969 / CBS 8797 / KCTC 17520 / NBRC 10181 / NCYC 3082 / Yp74L-3) TaxID=1071383 RepID=J7RFV1_HUIN7|nr:hypothetical protein KNAG_0A07650 [Kazachstania naganishii CBS 8797]CCK68418.1 hypothetical protein KNAG_0A07650 [Kazachstania naganishii CBS 8797]